MIGKALFVFVGSVSTPEIDPNDIADAVNEGTLSPAAFAAGKGVNYLATRVMAGVFKAPSLASQMDDPIEIDLNIEIDLAPTAPSRAMTAFMADDAYAEAWGEENELEMDIDEFDY